MLIFRVTSVRYCLIAQNGQVVENWRSASRTEIRTTDLAAMEITVDHQDDNHEVHMPTVWPVQKIPCDVTVCHGRLYKESAWMTEVLLIDWDRLGARTSLEFYPLCKLISCKRPSGSSVDPLGTILEFLLQCELGSW
ncbi:hypothetical protein AVEN_126896-1 [Araneus ventricosus]|uniref:Uncharacterized protein n=1 Tax=Araneus ventricosus TaxID=182803 RepID=A0A4Y2C2M2_ARAVE|nr:hypothetical protein AVEN_126896-1 [Araneus ventricosus]